MTNTPNVKTKQQTFAEMLKPLDVREFKRKNTTFFIGDVVGDCLLYTSPSPRD